MIGFIRKLFARQPRAVRFGTPSEIVTVTNDTTETLSIDDPRLTRQVAASKPRYAVQQFTGSGQWFIADTHYGVILGRHYSHKRGAEAAARRMNFAHENPMKIRLPSEYRVAAPPRYSVSADGPAWCVYDNADLKVVGNYAHKRGAVAAAKRMNGQ